MGFLSIRCRRFIDPWRIWQVFVAKTLSDFLSDGRNSLAAKLNPVSSHVGDQAGRLRPDIDAFVELLGNLHSTAGRKAKVFERLPAGE